MENFETYVDQISTALELSPEQKEKITTLISSFKDNEKLQLISQTQERVNQLLAADEQIKALKTGSLSQYMVNIQENWNMMSENLVQLQILSLLQKKGADCSEVINDILKILNTKLTAVNQILKANLGEVSSKTTSASSGLQQQVLSQADKAVAAATAAKQTAAKPTAAAPAKIPALASVVAKAQIETGQKPSTPESKTAAAAASKLAAAAAAKRAAATKQGTAPTKQGTAQAPAKVDTGQTLPPTAKLEATTPPAVTAAQQAKAAAEAAPAKPTQTPTITPAKLGAAPAKPTQTPTITPTSASAKPAQTPAKPTKKGGGDDIYLYKYLKYKTKYLSLKNNF